MQKRTLAVGELLILKDDASKDIYYLEKGTLQAYTYGLQGKVFLGEISEGELVGESSLILGEVRSATVEALSECTVICVKAEDFSKVLETQHPWVRALVKTLISRIRSLNNKLAQSHGE